MESENAPRENHAGFSPGQMSRTRGDHGMVARAAYHNGTIPANRQGWLRVMTYNVDEGTDFSEVQSATNFNEFLIAVGQTITQVRATNPPSECRRSRSKLLRRRPELVSLQEVDPWFSGPFNPLQEQCSRRR